MTNVIDINVIGKIEINEIMSSYVPLDVGVRDMMTRTGSLER